MTIISDAAVWSITLEFSIMLIELSMVTLEVANHYRNHVCGACLKLWQQ